MEAGGNGDSNDTEKGRHVDTETGRHGDTETGRHGEKNDTETGRHGDTETTHHSPNDHSPDHHSSLITHHSSLANIAFVMKCLSVQPDTTQHGTVVDHVRLFRNRADVRWKYRVHEQILPALRV